MVQVEGLSYQKNYEMADVWEIELRLLRNKWENIQMKISLNYYFLIKTSQQ